MDTEACAGQIAVIAQSESAWTRFVRSGEVFLVEETTLHRARRDLERRLTVKNGPKGSRQRRLRGAARIRGYLADHHQP